MEDELEHPKDFGEQRGNTFPVRSVAAASPLRERAAPFGASACTPAYRQFGVCVRFGYSIAGSRVHFFFFS
jgi:hypothetical protein